MQFSWIPYLFLLCACLSCSDRQNSENHKEKKSLRVSMASKPFSLDPRLVRDLESSSVMRMLYEGLMRTSFKGELIPGVAESYTLSPDNRKYTFYLRSSQWADGSPLTAIDFEESWKSVLSPSFPSPNAYQLYMIKGAQDAKEGRAHLSSIGVKAQDSRTLVVELEQPTPYFIKMMACHFFFPVHPSIRNSSEGQLVPTIGNGPFIQDRVMRSDEMTLLKNEQYWDATHVFLEDISLQVLDENTALQLFKAGQLDWAGSPLSTIPQDAVEALRRQNHLEIAPGAGTHWFRLNTKKIPFSVIKMRQAFALALDRQAIVEHVLQGNQLPAMGIVPPLFGFSEQNYYTDHDTDEAKKLFKQALLEIGLSKHQLPPIILSYASNDRNHKIAQAIQQQWNQVFDIEVLLKANELQVQLDKVKSGEYTISLGGWYADIDDPLNFLELFKLEDNPTNQTFWHNEEYAALLDKSSEEFDAEKRLQILAKAEKLLMSEMPVIPIFFASYNYLKRPSIQHTYFSPLGYIDFKSTKLSDER